MIRVGRNVYPYLIGIALLGVALTTVIAATRASLDILPATGIGSTAALHRAAPQAEPAVSTGAAAIQDLTPALRWRAAAVTSGASPVGDSAALRSARAAVAQDITPALRAKAAVIPASALNARAALRSAGAAQQDVEPALRFRSGSTQLSAGGTGASFGSGASSERARRPRPI